MWVTIYGVKSPVFSKQTFSVFIFSVLCVDEETDFLPPRSLNIASHKSAHVTVVQIEKKNRLSFNRASVAHVSFPSSILSQIITLLGIGNLTKIDNNCRKTTVFNLKKGIAE